MNIILLTIIIINFFQLQKEAKEAEKAKKELDQKKKKQTENIDEELVDSDPFKAILARKKEREAMADNFFAHLENKYGGGNKQKNKKSKGKK